MNWILHHPVETATISALTIFGLLFLASIGLGLFASREARRWTEERRRLDRILQASERPFPRAVKR